MCLYVFINKSDGLFGMLEGVSNNLFRVLSTGGGGGGASPPSVSSPPPKKKFLLKKKLKAISNTDLISQKIS